MEGKLRYMKENRGRLRAAVTRKWNSIDNTIQSMTVNELKIEVKVLRTKVDKFNEEIGSILCEDVDFDPDGELKVCEDYDSKFSQIIQKLELSISVVTNPLNSSQLNESVPMQTGSVLARLKLPELPLPKFSNKPDESLERFITNFENVIQKYALSEFEKFIFLEKQLSGSPLTLIKSLHGDRQSYNDAKQLLTKAFADPTAQKFEAVNKLSNLKLPANGDIYEFISEMRCLIHIFDSLKIDIQSVLQYFVWQAMPDILQNQLVTITNCNKPTLAQIEEHIFQAAERYKPVPVTPKHPRVTATGLAVNIQQNDNKSKKCVLCSRDGLDSDHGISKCTTYSSAKTKIEKIKGLSGCIRCSGLNHKANECRFNFRRSCYFCNGNHFSFLCLSNKSSVGNNSNYANSPTVTNKVNQMTVSFDESNPKYFSSSIILPTFSCKLSTGKSLRCLKDTGSQANFVTEKVFLSQKQYSFQS